MFARTHPAPLSTEYPEKEHMYNALSAARARGLPEPVGISVWKQQNSGLISAAGEKS